MEKLTISRADPDFEDYWVRIHGTPIGNVMDADAAKGEVRVHYQGEPERYLELKTGTVTITRKAPLTDPAYDGPDQPSLL